LWWLLLLLLAKNPRLLLKDVIVGKARRLLLRKAVVGLEWHPGMLLLERVVGCWCADRLLRIDLHRRLVLLYGIEEIN
jgi:hypothetical protein